MEDKIVKEQKVIAETNHNEFYVALSNAFRNGWRIVPGTIVISTVFGSVRQEVVERYVAVLEK